MMMHGARQAEAQPFACLSLFLTIIKVRGELAPPILDLDDGSDVRDGSLLSSVEMGRRHGVKDGFQINRQP
jgi:hypothetical protein